MYAVSQGAMAVEIRADDSKTLELLSCIHDQDTALSCIAERAFLKTLVSYFLTVNYQAIKLSSQKNPSYSKLKLDSSWLYILFYFSYIL